MLDCSNLPIKNLTVDNKFPGLIFIALNCADNKNNVSLM